MSEMTFEDMLNAHFNRPPSSAGENTTVQREQADPSPQEEEKPPRRPSVQARVERDFFGQRSAILSMMRALQSMRISGQARRVLVTGQEGSGRHFLIQQSAEYLHIPMDHAFLDCSRYQVMEEETNFLQDLYMAIQGGDWIVFDGIENLGSYFFPMIREALGQRSINLNKRYQFENGALLDTGHTLTRQAIGRMDLTGKALFFISTKPPLELSDRMGDAFTANLDHVVTMGTLSPQEAEGLVERILDDLRDRVDEIQDDQRVCGDWDSTLKDYLLRRYRGNAKEITQICDTLYQKLLTAKTRLPRIDRAHFSYDEDKDAVKIQTNKGYLHVNFSSREEELRRAKRELDRVVGLDQVKDYILSLEANVKMQRQREAQGMKTLKPSLHMIFTGNPGTGKTTMARILAKTLKALGVLSGGQFVEVSRVDLVARYTGQTAPLTQQVIRSAMGGVLFIDEAYSLYRGENDEYGMEAIDTLVKAMEDHRENLVVILAGYTREMQAFLSANSGLRSRFPNQLEFRDYTPPELMEILYRMAKGKDYTILKECFAPIMLHFKTMQEETGATAGNARMARNLLEEAILRQSKRCLRDSDAPISELRLEDFNLLSET